MVDALGQWEADGTVVELLHLWAAAGGRLDYFYFDDLLKYYVLIR